MSTDKQKKDAENNIENSIIDAAYRVTIEPSTLENFEKLWESYIDAKTQSHTPNDFDLRNAPLNLHIDRAIQIIDRIGIARTVNIEAQEVVDAIYGFGVVMDKLGNVLAKNSDASIVLQKSNKFEDYLVGNESKNEILKWTKGYQNTHQESVKFSHSYFSDTLKECCIFTLPIKLGSEIEGNSKIYFLVTSLDFEIEDIYLPYLQKTFSLTNAEAQILLHLVSGKPSVDIARIRKVKKGTLNKQIKIIRQKTKTKSITALVKKTSMILMKLSSVEKQTSRVSSNRKRTAQTAYLRKGSIILRDGRLLDYRIQGHPNGLPVLNIHTLLGNGELTPSANNYATRLGLKFIVPSRPGYGTSERLSINDPRRLVETVCRDLKELLDSFNIPKAIIVDAKYGQKFAAMFPEKTIALICLNSTPLWKPNYIHNYIGRKRNIIKTSMHAPKAVRILARVGQVLINSGQTDVMISGLNKGKPVDEKAMRDLEIYNIVKASMEHMAKQGVDAYAKDVSLMHTDWGDEARKTSLPISIIYGTKCTYLPKSTIDDYYSLVSHSTISPIVGAGTYLMHTHFKEFLDELCIYK